MRRGYQIGHQSLIDIEVALIFAEISDIMAFRQDAPDFRADLQGKRQYLENDVTIDWAIAMPTGSSEGERVRCVVSEVESALKG